MLRREPFFPRPADLTRMMPNLGPTLDPDSETQGPAPADNSHGGPDSHGEGGDQPRRRRRRRRGKGGGQGGQGGQGGPQGEQHGGGNGGHAGGVPPQHVSRLRKARGEAPPPPPPDGRDEIFERTIKFADLNLREDVLQGITEAGFFFPTYIQARIIPVILSGRDVLGQAKTGTGKTAAIGLPMLSRIERGTPFQALVLVPTRELAPPRRGGSRRTRPLLQPLHPARLRRPEHRHTGQPAGQGPEIIVATPGRVMDMVEPRLPPLSQREDGRPRRSRPHARHRFRDDIRRILKSCPAAQTVFVSATISPEIESLARSYANNAEKMSPPRARHGLASSSSSAPPGRALGQRACWPTCSRTRSPRSPSPSAA